jgi:hypothetical protein
VEHLREIAVDCAGAGAAEAHGLDVREASVARVLPLRPVADGVEAQALHFGQCDAGPGLAPSLGAQGADEIGRQVVDRLHRGGAARAAAMGGAALSLRVWQPPEGGFEPVVASVAVHADIIETRRPEGIPIRIHQPPAPAILVSAAESRCSLPARLRTETHGDAVCLGSDAWGLTS